MKTTTISKCEECRHKPKVFFMQTTMPDVVIKLQCKCEIPLKPTQKDLVISYVSKCVPVKYYKEYMKQN